MTAGLKTRQTSLLGEHSEREPPDPIPNSEVKPLCADDSVAGCHVKVGHRQALKSKALSLRDRAFFVHSILLTPLICFLLKSALEMLARWEHQQFNKLPALK